MTRMWNIFGRAELAFKNFFDYFGGDIWAVIARNETLF